MTETTAPGYTRAIAESTVKIFADHWGKATGAALAAFIGAATTYYFTPKPVAANPSPRIEYVSTVPAWLGTKMDACVEGIAELKDSLKPKVRVRGKKK
jgi:hypothetical protein